MVGIDTGPWSASVTAHGRHRSVAPALPAPAWGPHGIRQQTRRRISPPYPEADIPLPYLVDIDLREVQSVSFSCRTSLSSRRRPRQHLLSPSMARLTAGRAVGRCPPITLTGRSAPRLRSLRSTNSRELRSRY